MFLADINSPMSARKVTAEEPWIQFSPPTADFDLFARRGADIQLLNERLLDCQSTFEIKAEIQNFTHSQNSTFAFVFVSPLVVIACVDHVRSIPLFFQAKGSHLVIASHPALFPGQPTLSDDPNLVGEFLLTGYLHGKTTLCPDIRALEPGEMLEWDDSSKSTTVSSYFSFFPNAPRSGHNFDELYQEFDALLDEVFLDLRSQTNGRSLWIPLSGGLDSRLILAKCLQHQFEDITTFSYGSRGNHEIEKAKAVTSELGVPWLGVPATSTRYSRSLFAHDDRRAYAEYAGALQATPVYLDYEAITRLRRSGALREDACIVNGYSGDFLFGGHIPEQFAFDASLDYLLDAVLSKHCSHFHFDIFPDALTRIRDNLRKEFSILELENLETIAGAYENWEWRERQSKAVINGQRLYEFYGLDWALPFWDKRLINFWSKVPVHWKINQHFHIRYLRKYNYRGMFTILRSENKVWPTNRLYLPLVLRLLRLTGGYKAHDAFFERAFYYGYFHNQLSFFSYRNYANLINKTRQPRIVPLATLEYLQSLAVEVPTF